MKHDTRLVAPDARLENAFRDMLADWRNAGETAAPYVKEEETHDFEAYVDRLLGCAQGRNLPDGFVPYSVFWLVDGSGRVLGVVSIRHRLNDNLRKEGGHIGYMVRPSERGRGHATRLLGLALDKAKQLGLGRVLLTCDKANVASEKVIRANGGIFAGESVVRGKEKLSFWID